MGEQQYFSLDQLAQAAGMTARNVRAYQTRGLLQPPVRDGRSAVYDTDHLHRLVQVRRLREAGVPLRMIEQAVQRGEDLGEDGLLHTWAAGIRGTEPGDPSALRPVDEQVLRLAEGAVPGIRALLGELRLLVPSADGEQVAGSLVGLLVRLPSIGATHPQVLDVIRSAGQASDGVRRTLPGPAGEPLPAAGQHELAHVAATVLRACLTVEPLEIDLRGRDQPAPSRPSAD